MFIVELPFPPLLREFGQAHATKSVRVRLSFIYPASSGSSVWPWLYPTFTSNPALAMKSEVPYRVVHVHRDLE